MHFLETQTTGSREKYCNYLKAVSSLSNLFSDSSVPYINYRVAENLFCKAFKADNLSRSDISYDARKDKVGIGIKTFINQKISKFEKVAEFNVLSKKIKTLEGISLAEKLADFRNERIDFANRTYEIEKGLYHCITRSDKKLIIFETEYKSIDKDSLRIVKSTDASLHFKDRFNNYLYNHSKSTLFQKFEKPENALELKVNIIDDPFDLILKLLNFKGLTFNSEIGTAGIDYVILPLYSTALSNEKQKVVPEKSGLNQWNAGGRARKPGELYIPVPSAIHKKYPKFFPSRDIVFTLKTPDNEVLNAKLCQENSKALMTNPNDALEKWMLRKVLEVKTNKILTYDRLLEVGVDSVIVTKIKSGEYKIDFAAIDSYDSFSEKYLT